MNEKLNQPQNPELNIGLRFLRYFTTEAKQQRQLQRQQRAEGWAREWVDQSKGLSDQIKWSLEASATNPAIVRFKGYDSKKAILNYAELIHAHLTDTQGASVLKTAETDPLNFKNADFGKLWEPAGITTRQRVFDKRTTAEIYKPSTLNDAEDKIMDMRLVFTHGANNITSSGLLIVTGHNCHADLDTVAAELAASEWTADRNDSIRASILEG